MSNNPYPKLSESLASAEAKFPELLALKYPRILKRIELLWGSKESEEYFDSIFLGGDEDRSERQGFPVEILKEIVYLKQIHDFLFPSLNVNPYDPFSGYAAHAPNLGKNALGESNPAQSSSPAPDSASESIHPDHHLGSEPDAKRINWPIIHTQRALVETAEQWLNGSAVYPVQGQPVDEILRHYKLLDDQALRVIYRMQTRLEHQGKTVDRIILDAGIIRHNELIRALCVHAGILMVDIVNITIPFKTLRTIPNAKAREKQVMPCGIYQDFLFLAVADPFQFKDHQTFSAITGLRIAPVFAPRHEIVNRLSMYQ